jgi:hypothetical protein
MFKWLKRLLLLEDSDFNEQLPYGPCQAIIAWHAGMNVTCGTKTNMKEGGYWVCSKHPYAMRRQT